MSEIISRVPLTITIFIVDKPKPVKTRKKEIEIYGTFILNGHLPTYFIFRIQQLNKICALTTPYIAGGVGLYKLECKYIKSSSWTMFLIIDL